MLWTSKTNTGDGNGMAMEICSSQEWLVKSLTAKESHQRGSTCTAWACSLVLSTQCPNGKVNGGYYLQWAADV